MPSLRIVSAQLLVIVVSVAVVTSALADVTEHQKCQKAKILARGKWKSCRSGQRAKIVVGKTGDFTKCNATLAAKLVSAEKNLPADETWICTWIDNGDGTVSDLDTGLMWEKKNAQDGVANFANPHDFDNAYYYGDANGNIVGSSFLGLLNGQTSFDTPIEPGFAGYRDWRLPYVSELLSIVDTTVSYGPSLPCGSADYTPCIRQSVFGPTVMCFSQTTSGPCKYHSTTVDRVYGPGSYANDTVDFADGGIIITSGSPNAARAVRGGGD